MKEPLLKGSEIHTQEQEKHQSIKNLLPQQSVKGDDHNLFFTGLSNLIQKVKKQTSQGQQIQNEDVAQNITKTTQLGPCVVKLQNYLDGLEDKQENFNSKKRKSLKSIFWFMTRRQLIIGLTLSILQNAVGCGAIFILDLITDELKKEEREANYKIKISFMLLGIVMLYFIKNILFSQYTWCQAKWKSECRTTLQYVTFQKQLKSKIFSSPTDQKKSQPKKANGSDKNSKNPQKIPDINNIMTVDVNQCLSLYWSLIETVSSIITLTIVLVLIYYKIGAAILAGIYVLIASFLVNLVLTLSMSFLYSKQYRMKDKRIVLTKDVIDGIKSIKYLGWEKIFQKKIEKARSGEYSFIMSTRCLDGVISVFWNSISYFLLFFFLVDFINEGNQLKDSNVFTIIALFGYLTYPMGILPWSIGYLVKIRVSFNRICQFLEDKEITPQFEHRGGQNNEFANTVIGDVQNSHENIALQIKNMKFMWPSREVKEEFEFTDSIYQNKHESQLKECHDFIEEKQETQSFELNIEDFSIQKGTLNVIVGRTGSGKSALLNALLKEMDCQVFNKRAFEKSISLISKSENENSQIINNSSFYLEGKVAYVAQNHWLQNKSIRDNILFGEEYSQKWYDTCLKVCELKEDLQAFKEGDQKLVGPNGSNLSGGQKQRIALCRAVYSDSDIYLLDDIFSSLDAHVAKRIFLKSVKQLLVEKRKKTVLMVTSHFEILKAGKINPSQMILIDRGLIIRDTIAIEQFMKASQAFNMHRDDPSRTRNNSLSIEEVDYSKLQIDDSFLASSRSSSLSSLLMQKEDTEETNQEIKIKLEDKKPSEVKNEEVREQSSIKFSTLATYFSTMGYIFLMFFLAFNFLMQGSQMLIDFWLRDYTNHQSSFFNNINDTFDTFTKAFFFLIFLNLGITALRSFFYCLCALLSSRRMFLKLNKSILFSKMKFFDTNPVGRIISRLADDVDSVDYYLPWQSQTFMEQLAYSIGYPVGIIVQFPWIVIIILICFAFIYYVQRQFRDSNREIKRLNSVNTGKVLTVVSECCKGVTTIRAFEKQNYILKDFFAKLNESVNTFAVSQGVQVWMMIRLLTISNLVFCFVSISSIVIVVFDLDFNYNTIAMCLTYSILLSTRFSDLMQYFCNVEQYLISVERIRQYFCNEQENPSEIIAKSYFNYEKQSSKIDDQKERIQQLKEDQSDAEIEFQNVYLSYESSIQNSIDIEQMQGEQAEKCFALRGISFKIKKGEKIAFCGRTGSGKSSILNLIFGMYHFQRGEIFVKGKNIKVMTLQDLRQQMAIIPQFGFLFKSTLRDNLDPSGKLNDTQIQCKIANSGISLESIQFKEHKSSNSYRSENETRYQLQLQQDANLDSLIQEGGANLSNGQAQIINFLRIILKDTDIICLDEATSNMDPITDSLLNQALFDFSKNKTLIVVTHRLENIDKFDRVFVMDSGKIAECGHVSELRKAENGFFNRLTENQNTK
ncbi:ABC transporter C family protein (macronuclear) [Tetrahymena thermophila SB210]|uniref:ABC transporter C family protein n=1 Tax=Tetrahymena thermophila (strain SB210) TaxID=312017 RepID=Q241X4_TETTS|nr:ABC transporter C family protein [Tetrahymena thermophila SB210]EAS02577.3 ABC transporter C family protein [Tetrahymena thermophila SB210]|eukprot:XP_001022822.3 ABC transporter C family protein [Tetrahymena thermophila SB210]